MTLSTLLIILKYAGTGISGAAGIWGTVSETRDKKTGELSAWGKWALSLAIAGFVVALGSQIAEQIRDEREQTANELEHQRQVSDLKEQLALAKGMASSLESEATRFDTIKVWLEYELPMGDQRIKNLFDDLERIGASLAEGGRPHAGMLRANKKLTVVPEQFDPKSVASFAPLVDFFKVVNRSVTLIAINKQRQPGEPVPGSQMRSADLYADNNSHRTTNEIPVLFCHLSPRRALTLLLPYSDFKKEVWRTNEKIIGVHDLGAAELKLQVNFLNINDDTVSSLVTASRLVGGSISFGKHQCNLTELANTDSKTTKSGGTTSSTYNYKAVLPNADAILGR
jgi:hypothetical protein